jgi:hypothetical protein
MNRIGSLPRIDRCVPATSEIASSIMLIAMTYRLTPAGVLEQVAFVFIGWFED